MKTQTGRMINVVYIWKRLAMPYEPRCGKPPSLHLTSSICYLSPLALSLSLLQLLLLLLLLSLASAAGGSAYSIIYSWQPQPLTMSEKYARNVHKSITRRLLLLPERERERESGLIPIRITTPNPLAQNNPKLSFDVVASWMNRVYSTLGICM